MKSIVLVLCCIMVTIQLLADDASQKKSYYEISEDGKYEYRYATKDGNKPSGYSIRDIPYLNSPDWQNSDRVQVGALQVYDVDYDGDNDVVVGCYHSNSYPPYDDWHNFIYLNTGAELEAIPSWISDDEVSTGDIQLADINGDGFIDIFAANGGYSMDPSVIYYGSATGPSTAPGWYSNDNCWNNYAMPFDFDHDGDIDVLTANQGNSQYDPYRPMNLFINNNVTLASTPGWQSAEISIQNFLAIADVDGDGWEDVAVSKWSDFESGIYKNNAGTLNTTPWWTTGDTDSDKGVGFADVDDNGWPDLALGHDPTQLFTNSSGSLSLSWISTYTYFGQQDLRFCDVDMDGDQDLAEIHFSNGVVNIYMNDGGVLQDVPSWSYDCSSVGTAIAFGDINGNGSPDLVVGNSGDPSIMVFYNQNSFSIDDESTETMSVKSHPNPFSHSTTISFSNPSNTIANMKVYNLKGEIVSHMPVNAGQKFITWNGNDSNGKKVTTGIYFIQILDKNNNIAGMNKCVLFK